MHPHSRVSWWLFLLCGLLTWTAVPGAELDSFQAELQAAGIEPSRQGVEKILEPWRLTPARLEKIQRLLVELGNDLFQTREKAMMSLIALPTVPLHLLQEAAAKDPEIQKRVERILQESSRVEAEHKAFLALRVIEQKQLKGLAPLVLELLPQWQEDYLVRCAAKAVAVSAERSDGPALRGVIAQKRLGEARAAAVTALAAVFAREVDNELEGLLADTDARVVLAAAGVLLNQENRKPLTALTRLLAAEQIEVRQSAVTLLREVSGQQIDFASYDDPPQRAKGVAAWRAWVAREGATAKLNVPVGVSKWRGRIVAAVFGENVLREVDAVTGKVTFEVGGFSYPWGAHATPEGHRLAVDLSRGLVLEYDTQGKECWRQTVAGEPTGVQRLATPGKVVEIDRTGKTVWEVFLEGRPTTAQRLADGNTLVSLQNAGKVVSINRRGDVVWHIAGLSNPHTAEQLDNGHVLVCEFGSGINEYDRSGKLVWSKKGLNNPAQAQRLPNGNTVISGADGLMEFDPKGNLLRHFRMGRARFFAN